MWQHPTGGNPRTVALVCLGPSRVAHSAAALESDLSDTLDGVDETWTLNRGFGMVPHDLLFVMDHIQGEADKHPRYGAALWKHSRPIITSDNAEGWPAHVHCYPFRAIWNWLAEHLQPHHGDWWHNSVAYILAYAAFIGVKELRVFGADYSNHRSGIVEDGHPCVAYWAGKLEAAGLTIRIPPESAFLNADQRGWIYGYRDDPRLIASHRAQFRAMAGIPQDTALLSGERQVAAVVTSIQPDHVNRYAWAAQRMMLPTPGTVIDLGAGIGYGSHLLAQHLPTSAILSVDQSVESLDYGERHYAAPNIARLRLDLDALTNLAPLESPRDVAVAFELIEHLRNPEPLLTRLRARRLFISAPNEDVIPWHPRTAPFHFRHYTLEELIELLSRAGWRVTGRYGQTSPLSQVIPWQSDCRTIVLEAERHA